jgi:hypothetical protein
VGPWAKLRWGAAAAIACATAAAGTSLGGAGGALIGDDSAGYAGGGVAFGVGNHAEVEPGLVATFGALGLFGSVSARVYLTDGYNAGLRPYATAGGGWGVHFGGDTGAAAPYVRGGAGLDIRPPYSRRTAFVEACAFSLPGVDEPNLWVLVAAGMRFYL